MSAALFNALVGQSASKFPGALQFAYSDVIDLTAAPATYVVIPPIAARLINVNQFWEIKATSGASVSPTYSIGSNSPSFNNRCASQTTATLISQAAETAAGPTSVNPSQVIDLTASGLQVNITGSGTATTLMARFCIAYILLPV